MMVFDYSTNVAGNIAIGNIHQFLPVIIQQVQSNDEKRLLSLHALKEVSVLLYRTIIAMNVTPDLGRHTLFASSTRRRGGSSVVALV